MDMGHMDIEIVDRITGKKYNQHFHENMKKIDKPIIKKSKSKPYTKITWKVDFHRFGITQLPPDIVNLMVRRIYDIAGITDSKVNVYYNNEKVDCIFVQ